MKITLLGYMGSGKTSIGKILSKVLDCNFYDLDQMIIDHQNDSIDNIFKKKGEYYFRNIEHLLLKYFFLCQHKKKYVLSVGGGTPCTYKNIYLLNKFSKTFYLKLDSYTLLNRLLLEKKNRPLISHLSKYELFKFIMNHLSKRIFFYEKSFKKININNEKTEKHIIWEILKELYQKKL